jgi:hypothetical protein
MPGAWFRDQACRAFGLAHRFDKQRFVVSAPIFISYSSTDQKIAETICDALQSRGFSCWIACRDIGPGENFQEAIVKAIRSAKLMILVFTSNANNSDEIKKEVVLAGRHRVTVVPVRVEDVVPNDALAYEFATRQWIDLFKDWERNIEQLTARIANIVTDGAAGREPGVPAEARPLRQQTAKKAALLPLLLIGLAVVPLILGGGYFYLRPSPPSSTAPSAASLPASAADDTEWLAATNAGTLSAMRQYLVRFPGGIHVAQAQQVIRAADDKAWSEAERVGTALGFNLYVAQFPTGAHVMQARGKIEELARQAATTPPAPQPAGMLDAGRFDGEWASTMSCPATARALGYKFPFATQVNGAHLHAQYLAKGVPASMSLDGTIEPDGNALIDATAYTGPDPALNHGTVPPGVLYVFKLAARFANASGAASVVLPAGRPCDFTFAKK